MSAILSCADVLAIIDPADPDNLQHLGGGVYEARWSPTTSHAMDVEMIRRTEAVIVMGEPFEPDNLSGWTALQFTVDAP